MTQRAAPVTRRGVKDATVLAVASIVERSEVTATVIPPTGFPGSVGSTGVCSPPQAKQRKAATTSVAGQDRGIP